MDFLYLSCWTSVILSLVYLYTKWAYSYWQRKRIPFNEPKFPFGNLVIVNRDKHLFLQLTEIARMHRNSPIVGIYVYLTPVLIVKDPNLLRYIFIKDFQCFSHR